MHLHLVDLDHLEHILAANRANLNFTSTSYARTNVATVIEESILLFTIANLAKIHLLIGHFPVADTLAMAFAVFVATNVLVARLALDKCTLAMALVFYPVTLVSVPRWILHLTLAVALAKDKLSNVHSASV